MIARRNSRNCPTTAGGAGSDTDALQTDVMRFMSILGLCLMAVFALVQAIPLQDTDGARPEPAGPQLLQTIALQQQRTQRLQADLDRLSAQLQEVNERNSHARLALSSTQQQLTRLVAQTQQARSDRDRVTAELNGLHDRLAQGREELADIQRAAQQKRQSLQHLRQRLDAARNQLDDIDQRTAALRTDPAPAAIAPVVDKPPAPPAKDRKQGFTLRFASAGALESLVAAGTVSLYAMAGKQAWRLSLAAGHPAFAPVTFPDWFHEMAPSTVPPAYPANLEKSVGQGLLATLVWGVQLPAATRQGIASLTRDHRGGDLVIGADGRVTLEPG